MLLLLLGFDCQAVRKTRKALSVCTPCLCTVPAERQWTKGSRPPRGGATLSGALLGHGAAAKFLVDALERVSSGRPRQVGEPDTVAYGRLTATPMRTTDFDGSGMRQ